MTKRKEKRREVIIICLLKKSDKQKKKIIDKKRKKVFQKKVHVFYFKVITHFFYSRSSIDEIPETRSKNEHYRKEHIKIKIVKCIWMNLHLSEYFLHLFSAVLYLIKNPNFLSFQNVTRNFIICSRNVKTMTLK